MTQLSATFQKEVEDACKYYVNPNRIGDIGDLSLAGVALQATLVYSPTHATTREGRGEALKQAIAINLDRLKPPDVRMHEIQTNMRDGASPQLTREEEVYLCVYSYLHQQDPFTQAKITRKLPIHIEEYGIPQATYFLRRKKGLEQLAYYLSIYLAEQTMLLEPCPQPKQFIGRTREIDYYRQQLHTHRLAVIEGLGGIGKTALAAHIAQQFHTNGQSSLCWLTIRPGLNNTHLAVLHSWSLFLAQHGYPRLWTLMQEARAGVAIGENILLVLQEALSKVKPLLCLDNLETFTDDHDPIWSLIKTAWEAPHTHVLLTSQQRPHPLQLPNYELLTGFSPDEVRQFLHHHGIDMFTPEHIDQIMTHTNGNPRLLELWVAHTRLLQQNLTRSLSQIATSTHQIHDYLTTQIVAALSPGELLAAHLLARCRLPIDSMLLHNPPNMLAQPDPTPETASQNKDAPESQSAPQPKTSRGKKKKSRNTMLVVHDVPIGISTHDFIALHQRGLIHEEPGNRWTLSRIVSLYLQQQPCENADVLHQWLAHLYDMQSNYLESGYHKAQSGEEGDMILLFEEHRHVLIDQGQAPALIALLNTLSADALPAPTRALCRDLRAELYRVLGDYAAAERESHTAMTEATTAATQARAEWSRGTTAIRRGNVRQAATHYQRALRLLSTRQATLEAWLHCDLAWVQLEQSDPHQAMLGAQRARIAIEILLSEISRSYSKYDAALEHLHCAQGIADELLAQDPQDRRQLARIFNSRALVYQDLGQFERAIEDYKAELHIDQERHEKGGQATALLNMGICYAEMGQHDAAIAHETQALHIFNDLHDAQGQLLSHSNLAEVYLYAQQFEHAATHAKTAIAMDFHHVPPGDYADALRIYAEIMHQYQQTTIALAAASVALHLLRPYILAEEEQSSAPSSLTAMVQETLHILCEASCSTQQTCLSPALLQTLDTANTTLHSFFTHATPEEFVERHTARAICTTLASIYATLQQSHAETWYTDLGAKMVLEL